MSAKKELSQDTVLKMLREGYSRARIARELDISRTTLWRRLDEWGLNTKAHKPVVDPNAIVLLRAKGFTWVHIAALYGVSEMTIHRWRRKLEEKLEKRIH